MTEQPRLAEALAQFMSMSPGKQSDVRVFFAPGRINLIGEHLDYNGGLVLPAALTQGTTVFTRKRFDRVIRIRSTAFPEEVVADLDDLKYDPQQQYANYPLGAIWALQQAGVEVPGADLLFTGNLPRAAGLSSSASIEVVTAAAVNSLAVAGLSMRDLALLAQRAENEFVGVRCGPMDQFSVALSTTGRGLMINCATLETKHVPVHLGDYRLIVINSHKVRSLNESAYNRRREECEQALHLIQESHPEVKHLAALTPNAWEQMQSQVKDPVLHRRVQHVVSENHRVQLAVEALQTGSSDRFGELLDASHASLRDYFEVTGLVIDTLVAVARATAGCIGARMTGAGFGGCVIALVHRDQIDKFTTTVVEEYGRQTGLTAECLQTELGPGVREVTEEVFVLCQS